MSTDTSLTISNLQAWIGDVHILRGIDLAIHPGEIHVIMGPNGGGKSTLAQTMMGHPHYQVNNPDLKASNGKQSHITINGNDILGMSPDERARAGLFLAFQYPVAIPGVSVQNFLWKAYQSLHPEDAISVIDFRKKLAVIAEELGIKKELLARSLNDGFSGGEKKRVEILQLLALKPAYVILDEIDSGLDIDAIRLVASGIRSALSAFRPGVLIITHYQRILDYLQPDFVHVLMNGKIKKTGGMEVVSFLEKSGYADLEGV